MNYKRSFVVGKLLITSSLLSIDQAAEAYSAEQVEPTLDREAGEHETITVTGTHIRGVEIPVGSQLITIDREAIEQSGYATIRDLSQYLPQNFGGGATGERQPNNGGDFTDGSAFNLRGLGSTATLTLVNGRRIPLVGTSGSLADISNIPLAAIERVEVLPDGASAVYGADAVAGVVNVILRKNFNGQETNARFGTATQGELHEYQANHTAGTAWDTGNLLLSYEFYRRGMLRAVDRWYTRTMDHRGFGGQDYRALYGSPGNILHPTESRILFAIPPGQDGIKLDPDDLLPASAAQQYDFASDFVTLPRQKRHSLFGFFGQSIASEVDFYAEARFTHRKTRAMTRDPIDLLTVPTTNPYYIDVYGNGEPVRVAYSFHNETDSFTGGDVKSYGAVAGLEIRHPFDWVTRPYVSYSADRNGYFEDLEDPAAIAEALNSTDPRTALNPFNGGVPHSPSILNNLFYTLRVKSKSQLVQANLITDGPLFSLRGRTIRAAIGADYRNEGFKFNMMLRPSAIRRSVERKVSAVFGELRIPIASEEDQISGLELLELSGSLRHERYKDSSNEPVQREMPAQSTTNPRIGILYSPISGLRLNGSYGTSFRAPTLSTIVTLPSVSTTFFNDPSSPGGSRYVMVLSGVDTDLDPETATTWTAGVDVRPNFMPNLNLKASYFNIRFKDQVSTPNLGLILVDPAYEDLLVLNPSAEAIMSACRSAAPGRLLASAGDCSPGSLVTAILNARTNNLAETHIDGIDANVTYDIQTKTLGKISTNINASYLFNFKQAVTDRAERTERVDTPLFPVDFRARVSAVWLPTSSTNIALYFNYVDSYHDVVHNRKVGSWSTLDFTASYETSGSFGVPLLNNLVVQITVQNLLDNDPPYYESPTGFTAYDPTNAEPIGRFVAINLKKKW